MSKNDETVKVIYRRWRKSEGGEVFALFPEIYYATHQPSGAKFCNSYEHVGQHGGADYDGCVRKSSPASLDDPEVKRMHDELVSLGYKLRVVKRIRRDQMFSRQY